MMNSIQASGLQAHEILIIDDGSTDNTKTTALGLQERFGNLRVLSQSNQGVSATRNRGIREASGEYLFFVDADDSLVTGSFADVNDILKRERPDMLLFGLSFDYYKRGLCYRSDVLLYPSSGSMTASQWAPAYEKLYRYNMISPVWNKLIRRDLIMDHQLQFREDMIEMEDYLFSAECLLHCERIFLLDRVVYQYRQTEDERGTFNRLWRIPSLSNYMCPFYETSDALECRFSKDGIDCPAGKVSDQIYMMLFREQLRFASLGQIRTAAEDMLSGPYSQIISRRDPKLYQCLTEREFARVWCRGMYRRIRHQAAVWMKYIRQLRMNK